MLKMQKTDFKKPKKDSFYDAIGKKFVLVFFTPDLLDCVFLANSADIQSICYSKAPYLEGTKNILKARFYDNIDSAKSDIYTLRYHHREFLKIKIGIVPAKNFMLTKGNDFIVETYSDLNRFLPKNS